MDSDLMTGKSRPDLATATWQRSSTDSTGSVEVALLDAGYVALRDGKQPDGPVLVFTPGEWAAFTAGVDDGEFDGP